MIINTKYGPIDDAKLEKRHGVLSGGSWIEYYLGWELVHRSASVDLESHMPAFTQLGEFERYGIKWVYNHDHQYEVRSN